MFKTFFGNLRHRDVSGSGSAWFQAHRKFSEPEFRLTENFPFALIIFFIIINKKEPISFSRHLGYWKIANSSGTSPLDLIGCYTPSSGQVIATHALPHLKFSGWDSDMQIHPWRQFLATSGPKFKYCWNCVQFSLQYSLYDYSTSKWSRMEWSYRYHQRLTQIINIASR